MNNKIIAFLTAILIVWGLILAKFGANIFSVVVGIFATVILIVAITSWVDGGNTYKAKKHLADQFDKERK